MDIHEESADTLHHVKGTAVLGITVPS